MKEFFRKFTSEDTRHAIPITIAAVSIQYFEYKQLNDTNSFIHNHGTDTAWPILAYNFSYILKPNIAGYIRGIGTFAAFTSTELLQTINILPGTFDPKDITAFGLGTAAAYGLDKASFVIANRLARRNSLK